MFKMKHTMKPTRRLVAAVLALAAGSTQAACYVTVDPLAFGIYQAAQATVLDASFNVLYACDSGTVHPNYNFSAGLSGNVNARTMSNGTDKLQYQLYSDSARTQVLTAGTEFGNRPGRTVTYYGRIAANQDVSPGAYSDSVTLTVTP
jgi:spore coat protein U-like protein